MIEKTFCVPEREVGKYPNIQTHESQLILPYGGRHSAQKNNKSPTVREFSEEQNRRKSAIQKELGARGRRPRVRGANEWCGAPGSERDGPVGGRERRTGGEAAAVGGPTATSRLPAAYAQWCLHLFNPITAQLFCRCVARLPR